MSIPTRSTSTFRSTLDRDPVAETKDMNFKDDDLRDLWDWLYHEEEGVEKVEFNSALAKPRRQRSNRVSTGGLRPGEPPSLENSRNLIRNLFFAPRRYDLGRVGRHKLNQRLNQTEKRGPDDSGRR